MHKYVVGIGLCTINSWKSVISISERKTNVNFTLQSTIKHRKGVVVEFCSFFNLGSR
jgi:hypothetical protein